MTMTTRAGQALVLIALATAGCGTTVANRGDDGGTGAGDSAVDAPTLPTPLPVGHWHGTLARTCSDGTTATVDCDTSLSPTQHLTLQDVNGFSATILDRYTFTSASAAIWHDTEGGELGRCDWNGAVFTCRVTRDGGVQAQRTLDFSSGALRWDDTIRGFDGVTCQHRGTLARQ